MATKNKLILKTGLFAGIVYAGLMAGLDYLDGQYFRIGRFIFNLLFFGICMGLATRYQLKKQAKNES